MSTTHELKIRGFPCNLNMKCYQIDVLLRIVKFFSLIQWRLERHCIEDENTNGMVISVGGKPILEIIPKGELLEKLQKIIKKDKENDNTCAKVGRS